MNRKTNITKQAVFVGSIVGKDKDGEIVSLDTVLIKRIPSKKNPRIMEFLLEAGFPYDGIPLEYQYDYKYFKDGKDITADIFDVTISSCLSLEEYAVNNDYQLLCVDFDFVDVIPDYMLLNISSSLEENNQEKIKTLQMNS
ncbi:MAG: hypothetical protein E7168_05685 [Firmicutes bacterium]|nr:hypothetical protein [Bacillota bacterium]